MTLLKIDSNLWIDPDQVVAILAIARTAGFGAITAVNLCEVHLSNGDRFEVERDAEALAHELNR